MISTIFTASLCFTVLCTVWQYGIFQWWKVLATKINMSVTNPVIRCWDLLSHFESVKFSLFRWLQLPNATNSSQRGKPSFRFCGSWAQRTNQHSDSHFFRHPMCSLWKLGDFFLHPIFPDWLRTLATSRFDATWIATSCLPISGLLHAATYSKSRSCWMSPGQLLVALVFLNPQYKLSNNVRMTPSLRWVQSLRPLEVETKKRQLHIPLVNGLICSGASCVRFYGCDNTIKQH